MDGKGVQSICPDEAFAYCALEYCPSKAPGLHPVSVSHTRSARAANDRLLE